MTESTLLAALSESQVLALTAYGEARDQPIDGRIAIVNVIRNRVKAQRASFGRTARAVCLKPWQFSCWRPEGGKANYDVVLAAARTLTQPDGIVGPILRECVWIAEGALAGAFRDSTRGATHYLTAALYGAAPPAWARGLTPVCRIGAHVFFVAK